MVASKILHEGEFLYDNGQIFRKIKEMLLEGKIPEKLPVLGKEAMISRKNAESYFLESTGMSLEEGCVKLFYTKQEKEEIF